MAKYCKKPVEVEAFQLSLETILDRDYPEWFVEAAANGIVRIAERPRYPVVCTIRTLEGEMSVNLNDYIVKGVKGELYPCKPDIFETTYEEC